MQFSLRNSFLICAVFVLVPLVVSCHRKEIAKTKQLVIHLAAQERAGGGAAIITEHSTFLDEVTATGEQGKTTRLSARILRLDLSSSGRGIYDEDVYLDIGLNTSPVDGGLVGQDLYFVLTRSTGYWMHKYAGVSSGHTPQELYLGRARLAFYESGEVSLFVDGSEIKLVDLKTGQLAEIPPHRRTLMESVAKLAMTLRPRQSICVANGIAWMAHADSGKAATVLTLSDISDTTREPLTITLEEDYGYPEVKMIPSVSGEVIVNVYGRVMAGRFIFQSFRFRSKKGEALRLEPSFRCELRSGEVDSLQGVVK